MLAPWILGVGSVCGSRLPFAVGAVLDEAFALAPFAAGPDVAANRVPFAAHELEAVWGVGDDHVDRRLVECRHDLGAVPRVDGDVPVVEPWGVHAWPPWWTTFRATGRLWFRVRAGWCSPCNGAGNDRELQGPTVPPVCFASRRPPVRSRYPPLDVQAVFGVPRRPDGRFGQRIGQHSPESGLPFRSWRASIETGPARRNSGAWRGVSAADNGPPGSPPRGRRNGSSVSWPAVLGRRRSP